MLKVPTPNSNLNLFTFTFHYIKPTNAQQMHFSPVNKTVCPLECAPLTSHHEVLNCLHLCFIPTYTSGILLLTRRIKQTLTAQKPKVVTSTLIRHTMQSQSLPSLVTPSLLKNIGAKRPQRKHLLCQNPLN
jgi:hypothetical protein